MLKITRRAGGPEAASATLTLPFEQRQKSRLRVRLDSGEEAGLHLPRGQMLRDGDLLRADNGVIVAVCAAPEPVSTARTKDALSFARACYHLGNRHVPLQIDGTFIRYPQDPVLDELVRSLGLDLVHELSPFEPEAGAYQPHGTSGHAHAH